ncbi:hypothetical protein CRG98_035119 [Punica granatum]|uniref:Pentatricopeptide repeat-containing protein At4g02750-like n=1 Tax=Punica granatum TaxID=22663 RepID=A0A2I0IKF2_PUNGR|nr:hypothetical protein CRG98_035119 [Punica granatum]
MAPPVPLSFSRQIGALSSIVLNSMIRQCLRDSNLKEALQLFDRNPASRDVVSWNLVMDGLIENHRLNQAQRLFDEMPHRDVASWNTILSGYHRARDQSRVYLLLRKMGRFGFFPNEYTISIVITAFLGSKFSSLVPQIHARVFHLGLGSSVFVASALMKGYANIRESTGLQRLFNELLMKDVSSWNTLISGCMEIGCIEDAERAFRTMPAKNSISWTSLLNGYIINGRIDKAQLVFETIQESERNVYLWTVMISGYVKDKKYEEALMFFISMVNSGAMPNHFTYSCTLSACALTSSLLLGQQVHVRVVKYGMPNSVVLLTSLVDMYAKCGDIVSASRVFQKMQNKNSVSWNSIIGGLARHGLGTRALEMFEQMIEEGTKPDQVSFVNVLYACGHVGLVREGEAYFKSMKVKYGIEAELKHYACMVDLYGKAGELDKAERLIKEMPIEPDVVVWGAFIGASAMHSTRKLSEFAVQGIERLKKDHPAVYSMFLKIHAEEGSWSEVTELKRMLGRKHVEKQKAGSWVELR